MRPRRRVGNWAGDAIGTQNGHERDIENRRTLRRDIRRKRNCGREVER